MNMLKLAGRVANLSIDRNRKAFIGAVSIRRDGAIVSSRNGSTPHPEGKSPSCHAEVRALKKSGYGATVYVCRLKKDGSISMSKPCSSCMAFMRSMRVKKVYYTINESEYGVINF